MPRIRTYPPTITSEEWNALMADYASLSDSTLQVFNSNITISGHTLSVSNIIEDAVGTGVTIDGVLLRDGTIVLSAIPTMDDGHIPNIETLSYGGAFANAQIPDLSGKIFDLCLVKDKDATPVTDLILKAIDGEMFFRDSADAVSKPLALDCVPIIPHTKTNFANQNLLTTSTPEFYGMWMGYHIFPTSPLAYDIGGAGNEFRRLYLSDKLYFGDLQDVCLYRSASNMLKSDDGFQCTSLGISATTVISASRVLTNLTGKEAILSTMCNAPLSYSYNDRYYGFGTYLAQSDWEIAASPFPAGKLKELRVYVRSNTLDGFMTVYVYMNGADTGLAVAYGAGETGGKSDTDSITVNAGDRICIHANEIASAGTAYFGYSVVFDRS